jgi:hypothetical protein
VLGLCACLLKLARPGFPAVINSFVEYVIRDYVLVAVVDNGMLVLVPEPELERMPSNVKLVTV